MRYVGICVVSTGIHTPHAKVNVYPGPATDSYQYACGRILNDIMTVILSAQDEGSSIEEFSVQPLRNIGMKSFQITFDVFGTDESITTYSYHLMEVDDHE